MIRISTFATILCCIVLFAAPFVQGQTTEFTFQGSLQNSSAPANGNFDFEFLLFDALSGGTQLGTTLVRSSVAVTAGTFAVNLDFGSQFSGANRFLEIRVRQTGGGGFTPLTPRQSVGSSPYSVQSLNATNATSATTANTATNANQLGGVAANQYVVTTDPRMTDSRNPLSGSSNYIQNQNAGAQASSNFNVSGNGTAGGTLSGNIVNAATQYNLGGNRILRASGSRNLFAGVGAAGQANQTGSFNSFFGSNAGFSNTTGDANSFFGSSAGLANTTSNSNSFFGSDAGRDNTTGGSNSFFGTNAGVNNTTGNDNSFFGRSAGRDNTTGGSNSFFGKNAGVNNTTGTNNTIIGIDADVGSGNLNFATAIGAGAVVTFSNAIQLGRNGIDRVLIGTLGVAGPTAICLNANNTISSCSSSIRYKKNIQDFSSGLDLVRNLRPVSFNWKADNKSDIGLVAEEVAAIEPLLITYNDKGEVEGVKYDQISLVLINAIKEQQAQIEYQAKEIAVQKEINLRLQKQVNLLTRIICKSNPSDEVCREEK